MGPGLGCRLGDCWQMLIIVEYLSRVFDGLKIGKSSRIELPKWQLDELYPIAAICDNCIWALLQIADKSQKLPAIPANCQQLPTMSNN